MTSYLQALPSLSSLSSYLVSATGSSSSALPSAPSTTQNPPHHQHNASVSSAKQDLPEWQASLYEQVQTRDASQRDCFRTIFENYARLATQLVSSKQRAWHLEQELNNAKQHALLNASAGSGKTELEQKVLKLSEELNQNMRLNLDNATAMLRLKTAAEEDEKALMQKEEELAKVKAELDLVKTEQAEDKVKYKQIDSTIGVLKKELDIARQHLETSESKSKQLAEENNRLIEKLLAMKEEQAKEMNLVNDMYANLVKKAQDNERLIKEIEEKKKLATTSSSASSSSTMLELSDPTILDPTAWEGNFNVVVPKRRRQLVRAHQGNATCVNFNSNNTILASCGTDKLVRLWDARTTTGRGQLRMATCALLSCCFGPKDELLIGAGVQNVSYVWNVKQSKLVHTLMGHSAKVCGAAFELDTDNALTASTDRTIKEWDMGSGQNTRTTNCESACNFLSVSPSGTLFAGAHLDSRIRIWSTKTGELVHNITDAHTRQATGVEFSRDGTQIVTCSRDNTIKIIDVRTFKTLMMLKGSVKSPYVVGVNWSRAVFSPDAQFVAAGAINGTVIVWKSATGAIETVLGTPEEVKAEQASAIAGTDVLPGCTITSVIWNRAGRQIVSCNHNGDINFWEPES